MNLSSLATAYIDARKYAPTQDQINRALSFAYRGVITPEAKSTWFNLALMNEDLIGLTDWPENAFPASGDFATPDVWVNILNRVDANQLVELDLINDAMKDEHVIRPDLNLMALTHLMDAAYESESRNGNVSAFYLINMWNDAASTNLSYEDLYPYDFDFMLYFASRRGNDALVDELLQHIIDPIPIRFLVYLSQERVQRIMSTVGLLSDETDEKSCILAHRYDLLPLAIALNSDDRTSRSTSLLTTLALSSADVAGIYLDYGLRKVMPSPLPSVEQEYDKHRAVRINSLNAVARFGSLAIRQAIANGISHYTDTSLVGPGAFATLLQEAVNDDDVYVLHPLHTMEQIALLAANGKLQM